MTNWDYKLEPEEDERAEQVYDRVDELDDKQLIEYAKAIGYIETDDDGKDIIPDLKTLREKVSEYIYWDDAG